MNFKAILETDARWSDTLRVAERPGLLRTIAMVFAHSGDSWFWGLGLVLLWTYGDSFWKKWAVYDFFWISILIVVVMTLKFSIRRRRPAGEWGAIYRNTDPHSFPSGHAARALLIAVIALALGPVWLALILWVWAPLVALARVMMGVHYVSDIVAGAVVGVMVALGGLALSNVTFAAIEGLIQIPLW